jgi:HSP20 family molecular chaperone IbpA
MSDADGALRTARGIAVATPWPAGFAAAGSPQPLGALNSTATIHTFQQHWRGHPMARDVARDWMWSEACDMLARAERLHRHMFRPAAVETRQPAWEPPVDVLETEFEVLALVALPGVDVEKAEAAIEDGELVIAGTRTYPAALRTAIIHRLELPHGRFYRRLRLPAGHYTTVRRVVVDGCLVITLQKAGASRG